MKTKKRIAKLDYNYLNGSYLLYVENAPGMFAWYLNGKKRANEIKKRLEILIELMYKKRKENKEFDMDQLQISKIIFSKNEIKI